MIRLKSIFCKIAKNKKSAVTLIEESLASAKLSDEVCPNCGCCGKCKNYGHYTRNIVDYMHGKVVTETVEIPRVICTSCSDRHHKHTHALLPDVIIPYGEYSLIFILYVLLLYYSRKKIEDICERFGISPTQLYRWKKLFEKHKEEWLGALSSSEKSNSAWAKQLLRLDSYSAEFSFRFLRLTTRSFLQNHANPANCRYPKFPPQ